jgi:hypothetical protein
VDYVRIYKVTAPFRIAIQQAGANMLLSWPSNVVCRLQTQTNAPSQGISTNWLSVSTPTNQMQISPEGSGAFYRLVMP